MATYYWFNGAGTWSSFDTANWSTSATLPRTSAGLPPTSADDVVFDNLSGTGTVTLTTNPVCRNVTATALSTSLQFLGGTALSVHGSANFGANATFITSKLAIDFYGTGSGKTVTITNTSLVDSVSYVDAGSWSQSASTIGTTIFVSFGATVTFTGAITTSNIISGGTLTTGAFAHSLNNFDVSGIINLTNTTLNLTGFTADFTVQAGATLTTTNSTINCGSAATTFTSNFSGGGFTYNAVNMAATQMRLLGLASNTFSTLTATGAADINSYLEFTNSQTITNVLTIQGNSIAPYRLFVYPAQVGAISETPPTVTLTLSGAGAKTFKWADFQDITLSVTGTAPTFISVGDCLGNTGFTFTTAVTRFAVSGGVSKNFSSTTLWSASSGGATGATSPLPQDTVIFDSNANAEVVFDMPRIGKDVTFNTGVGFSANVLGISYSYIFGTPNSEALNKLVSVYLESRSSILVPSCSVSSLTLNGYGGTYTLSGAITVSNGFVPIHGSFYSSGYSVTVGNIDVLSGSSSASWYGSTSNITSTTDFRFISSGTISLASTSITMGNAGLSPNFSFPSSTVLGNVIFSSNNASSVTLFLSNNITISKLINAGTAPKSFQVANGSTTTIDTLEISGSSSSPVLFRPTSLTSGSTAATINLTNSVTTSFVAFCLITKTGAGTLNATGVANLGRNTGITFSSTLYGIAYSGSVGSSVAGSFTVPSDFSGSSMLVVLGGGGGGAKRNVTTGSAAGGGAGALAVLSNPLVSAGQVIYFQAGAGGAGGVGAGGGGGGGGTASWMNISSNTSPSSSAQGALAPPGTGTFSNQTGGGAGGSTFIGTFGGIGGGGGSGVASSTAGSGGGGSAPRLFTTITTGYAGRAGASSNSGGAGGGGYGGIGGLASTTTGGLGGLNSLGAQASGGTAGNPGSNGTSGGGGGGGGGATTASAGGGGVGDPAPDFQITSFNGSPFISTIGPSGGGGGGGTATSTGTGGAGGAASFGAGGGGGGRGGTVANNGSGGNGGVGFVLFVYTPSTATPSSQGSIIG